LPRYVSERIRFSRLFVPQAGRDRLHHL